MKQELLMKRDGGVLRPYTDIDYDLFKQIDSKRPVMVRVHQPRNPEHHRKLWALAAKVADFDKDFTDADFAVEWVKLHIPSMHKAYQLDGRIIIQTKSINFSSMDQVRFNRFYDRALYLWSQKIGCDPETLLDALP